MPYTSHTMLHSTAAHVDSVLEAAVILYLSWTLLDIAAGHGDSVSRVAVIPYTG